MLLNGNDFSGLFCCLDKKLLVQRFDRVDVDHFCFDAVFCQHLSRCQRLGYHKTGCYDSQILTFPEGHTLSELEFIIRTVIDHRCSQTAETEIYRSHILVSGFHSCFCLDIITGVDNNHAGDHTHQGNIFVALMGCSVLSYRKTCMSGSNLHIQMRITDGVSHLLKGTACCKHGKRTHEGNFSCCGKTGCNACHITLCNTAVDVAIRKYFFKHTGFGGFSKVSIQNHEIFMLFSQFHQSVSVTLSGSDLLYF